ncbi:MAG TPA: hypothetical protein EYQ60_16460 [Myxococcales bacterium]|nr:hypothetical protein [Myxococcales bacterium]HIK86575.1 hypothetical protein [Myxococcales bacterium]
MGSSAKQRVLTGDVEEAPPEGFVFLKRAGKVGEAGAIPFGREVRHRRKHLADLFGDANRPFSQRRSIASAAPAPARFPAD